MASKVINLIDTILVYATSSEYGKFQYLTESEKNGLLALSEELALKYNVNGAVKWELRVVYKRIRDKDGNELTVYLYSIISGYYNSNGDKFTTT